VQKETVIAKVRAHIDFNEETIAWFESIENTEIWFTHNRGMAYLSEFGGQWDELFTATIEPEVQAYFRRLGLSENRLPHVRKYESYSGSWIIDASVAIFATVGTTYTILKGLSELPKIADGLTELKTRLTKELKDKINKKATKYLEQHAQQHQLPEPPNKTITLDLIIDARPLLSLTPSQMKSHKVHLNVGISRDGFTMENLGEELMQDIKIGIFKSLSERNQWSYADSFMGSVGLLSCKQTLSKDISEFKNASGMTLDLTDDCFLYLDCWIQDNSGIYLFMFFLEKE
jgi:hypothetical protein